MAESTETPLFVARPSDVATLKGHFDQAVGGSGTTVALQAPIGGGKRALVGEFLRSLTDFDGLVWRVGLIEEEEGMRTLLRLYATLYASASRDPMLRGRVEMLLNAQMPQKPKRVQQWYQAFIEGLKKGQKKDDKGGFQVTLPRDNPAIGLIEIVSGIAAKMPVVLEIQNLQSAQSVTIHALCEALAHRAKDSQLLVVLSTDELSDLNKAWMPAPMIDLLERRTDVITSMELAPWGTDEVQKYLDSKGWSGDAANLATLTSGRPGFVAELADLFNEDGRLSDLSGVELKGIYPAELDEDELEEPEGEPAEGRRHATADDLDEIAFRAALLGRAFPSNLVADVGSFDRDSVDDLLDAAGDLFEEMQFSQALGTWIYQFKKASYREAALAKGQDREDTKQVAKQTATFLERYLVPRAYDFVVKTARLYAQAEEPARANVLRSMALSGDQPQVWSMSFDLLKYFDEIAWPDAMRRTVYMNLMDRMVGGGDVSQAENLYNEVMAWADTQDDRPLKAWLLFAGSRLDYRRQDFYRARDRAKDALTLYQGAGDKLKIAEVQNHQAMIELSDGNPEAALSLVDKALADSQIETTDGKKAVLPQVAANAEFIRGLVRKRERKWLEAAEFFRRSNEIAGNTGQAALALESGINFGEMLLVGGEHAKAADILQKVLQIAGALKNPLRQRAACSLLAQAQGALKNFDAALNWSKQTLALTEQLKLQRFVAIDTYNVGLFTMMNKKPTEALALFRKARATANLQQDVQFAKELLFNLGMSAAQVGEKAEATAALTELLPAARQAGDARKFVAGSQQLARLLDDKAQAKQVLTQALQVCDEAKLKEEKRGIKKQMEALA